METTMMHRFTHPGVFTVSVECSTSDWHVTAQRAITIQEPVREFGVIRCFSRNMSTDGTKCNALNGEPVHIQLMVERGESVRHCGGYLLLINHHVYMIIQKTCPFPLFSSGTNVSYTIQHDDHLVVNSSVDRGITPHNITLNVSAIEKLGHGCHNLTLSASNWVTAHPVSSGLELCLLEPVEGLQASVEVAEEDKCLDITDLVIGVSLERGAPAKLLFTLIGRRDNMSETRDMLNGSIQTYMFSSPLEGTTSLITL